LRSKKRVKNGEYYTLMSATLFLRVAFFMLTEGMADEFFLMWFFDLGIADFLLIELLVIIIISMHYKGKEQIIRSISVTWTCLFAVLVSRLSMVFIYEHSRDRISILLTSALRVFSPVIVYILPVGILIALVFTIKPDKIKAYIKNSLLKPTSIMFFAGCFIITAAYVYASVECLSRIENFNFSTGKTEDYLALIDFLEQLKIFEYSVNSLFICGTALCFYRGARIAESHKTRHQED